MASVRQPIEPALEPESDWLEEVVDGEILKLPPPSEGHAALIQALQEALQRQLGWDAFEVRTTAYGQGIQGGAAYTSRIPDLAVFHRAELAEHQRQERERGYLWLPPKLLVECLSPSDRKKSRWRLLADYESIAAPEVWLIYPEKRRIEIHIHDGSELQLENTVTTGTIRPRLCPADVNVDELWQAFDRG